MDKEDCGTCFYAEWQRTKSGKLHPVGQGRCIYKVSIVLPKAYYFIGSPTPLGGLINRKNPLEHCPTWKQEETKGNV